MGVIPTVDLGEVGLSCPALEPSEDEWHRVGRELRAAFTETGFVYLTNHGIPEEAIAELFSVGEKFFRLDEKTKKRYGRGVADIQGYTALYQEKLSKIQGLKEVRESYDVVTPDGVFPDAETPRLRPAFQTLFDQAEKLSHRILTVLAIALGQDRNYFVDRHQRLSSQDNSTSMRLLYYPVQHHEDQDDKTQCGAAAHTDYGTLTMLFQDESGGLEIRECCGGAWVEAKPIPGTLMVNVGDMLQYWSGDCLRATEHRVVLRGCRRKARQSVVFFVHPDGDVVVEPLDGSEKYAPVAAKTHAIKRFEESYAKVRG